MISKERLVFDPTAAAEGDAARAYLSSSSALLTSTTDGSKERLDVTLGAEYAEGSAFTAGDKGVAMLAVNPSDEYVPLRTNADGELLVDVQITTGSDKVEDTAHVSGDIGTYILSVREDTLATSTSADGDYQSLKTDSLGRLWTNVDKIAKPDGHTAATYGQNTIDATAEQIISSPLAERKKMLIQNVSTNRTVFLGFDSSVDSSTGVRLSSGAAMEIELGPGLSLWAIANAAGADIRYFELA
jgi:hypothetical protein